MSRVKKNKFEKTEELRQSQPELRNIEYEEQYLQKENLSYIERINIELAKNRTILKICKKFKLDPIYLLLMILVPIIILLLTFFTFTTTMISTLYPLYCSLKTLQYQVNKSKVEGKLYKKEDEDNNTTQWLSYWLAYAFVINTECILGFLVDKIIYKLMKFLFFIACFLPQIQLSVIIYNYFTGKLYRLYGETLENSVLRFLTKSSSNEIRENGNSNNNENDVDEATPIRKKNE
jgi:hypothetical protein